MVDADQYLTTTAKLLPYVKRSNNSVGAATAYMREPDPTQAGLGELFGVVEALAPGKQAYEVVDLILTTATKTYYANAEAQAVSQFEAAIKAVNEELATFATHGNNAWVGKVSAVLAVVSAGQVHLTQAGSASAYLFRRGQNSCITTGLATKEPHRPSKTFTNIASGQLQSGDRLMLATPALLHQLSLDELSPIVTQNSAATAVQKLQQILTPQTNLDRIAATISEIAKADEAAMMPQTGLSKEARLGKPENMAAVARENAAPIMSAIGRQLGRYLGWVKQTYRNRLSPGLKRSSLAIAAWLRRVLSHRRGRWLFLAGVVMVIFLGIFMLSRSGNDRSLGALAKQYQDALSKEAHAADQLSTGDKLGAKANYQASLDELNVVLASPKAAKLDAYLAKHRASEDDPASATKLRDLVSAQLDQIDGLTKVNPGQLADFSALGNAKPSLMVAVGSQLIFIDPSAASSIYRYDTAKAKLDIVADHPAKLGHVVAATPSSSGDGVYLLTDQPAVWFYNSNDSSLSQQTSAADWPKGKAIASYAGNLYIMADDAIYKLTRTAGGFSAKAAYPINDPSVLTNATTLAVDGNIYVGNAKGFTRILSGVVQKSDLIFPSNLMNPRAIISTNAAKSITVNDAKSNRIGLFSFDGAAIQSNGQISINGINTIYQTTGASSDKTMYVLADQKLVKISY